MVNPLAEKLEDMDFGERSVVADFKLSKNSGSRELNFSAGTNLKSKKQSFILVVH